MGAAEGAIPEPLKPALDPVLEVIRSMTAKIREFDKTIESVVEERYPVAAHLQQIRGIGPLTSLAFVLILEDPDRFRKSRDVGPYLGLVPARRASGESNPQLRITKAGDGLMNTPDAEIRS